MSPSLLYYESVNALHRYVIVGQLTVEARQLLELAIDLEIELHCG